MIDKVNYLRYFDYDHLTTQIHIRQSK